MNLLGILSERIHKNDIQEILLYTEGNDQRKQELYVLIFHEQDRVAYQALWVLTHFNAKENAWLFTKQKELIDEALHANHPGKRRLFLCLLLKQSLPSPPDLRFLDFCLERMCAHEELPGVQSLCIKLAYVQCQAIPELLQEFHTMLQLMEPSLLMPAVRSARQQVLKKMR